MGRTLEHDEVSQLLGAYALDSCTLNESAAIEAHGTTCSACAAEISRLRDAAGWLAVATGREPPEPLRTRVLDAARERRAPRAMSVVTYETQLARMTELLETLDDDDWQAPTADGRTSHHLVVHLAAIQSPPGGPAAGSRPPPAPPDSTSGRARCDSCSPATAAATGCCGRGPTSPNPRRRSC